MRLWRWRRSPPSRSATRSGFIVSPEAKLDRIIEQNAEIITLLNELTRLALAELTEEEYLEAVDPAGNA